MLGGINNALFFKSFAGFVVIALFILILRWAFSTGHSLVERPSKRGKADEYGLFVPVASPSNFIEGEILRQKLIAVGIKANLTQTLEGPRVMVFKADAKTARAILDS
jgi:hypothetical protein